MLLLLLQMMLEELHAWAGIQVRLSLKRQALSGYRRFPITVSVAGRAGGMLGTHAGQTVDINRMTMSGKHYIPVIADLAWRQAFVYPL